MNRRSFLATSGVAITTLSAGCTGILSSDEPGDYEFSLYNGARETRSFRIRVGRGAQRDWFYDETFEFAWPASHSELGDAARHANIYYEPTQAQEILITA